MGMDVLQMIQEGLQKIAVVGGVAGAYAFYRHLRMPTLEYQARSQRIVESGERYAARQRATQPIWMKRIPYDQDETPPEEW